MRFGFHLFVCCVCLLAQTSSHAINCRLASTTTEIAICNSKELTTLDEHLNNLFRAVKQSQINEQLDIDQKNWIKLRRDPCTSSGCLQMAYQTRLDELKKTLAPWCESHRKQLSGTWSRVGESGFFEEFSAGPNSEFDSWLHQRPEITGGSWTLNGCHFVAKGPGSLTVDLILLSVKDNELRFIEEKVPGTSRYKRTGE